MNTEAEKTNIYHELMSKKKERARVCVALREIKKK